LGEECPGFYGQVLEEARAIERPQSDEGADEHEALRRRLLKALRRQPGDVRDLMRHAESLSRMAATEHRMSPKKTKDLTANFRAVFESLGDHILPAD